MTRRTLQEQAENRREFFRDGIRYGLLALLAGIAALARPDRALSGQRCVNQGLCGGCRLFVRCRLPQALSARSGSATAERPGPPGRTES